MKRSPQALSNVVYRWLADPLVFSTIVCRRPLRAYQVQPARAIVDSVLCGRGLAFAVMMSRQAGKNELSGQLEAYLLSLYRRDPLVRANVDPAGFLDARLRLALAPAYIASHGMVIGNSSAAPDLPMLSMIIPYYDTRSSRQLFLRADILAQRMLALIERAPGFATYIVDRSGSVLAHPDPALMVSGRPLSEPALLESLLASARRYPDAVIPGYTHLRRAQAVLWPHYLLAYVEMLSRDYDQDRWVNELDMCPALATPENLPLLTGDADWNEEINSSDLIYLVNFVFKGGFPPLPVEEVGDADCNGRVTSADIVLLVDFVFRGGPEPCDVCAIP